MVDITEDDKNIYIKINKNGNLDRIYNKNYFFSLGLDVIEKKQGGIEKTGNIQSILDKSETAIDKTGSAITKKAEEINETLKQFDYSEKLEFIIEKSSHESGFKTLSNYLETIKASPILNPLTVFFQTGIDYIILDNLTNDICSCLDYIKRYGFQLIEKKKEDVYLINGRFLIITEDLILFDEKKITEEESVLRLLSEISGINYVRGEDHFKTLINGTHLYAKLKSLI